MWIERYPIVVPTPATPEMETVRGSYAPSWVELSIMAGEFAFMAPCFMLFFKIFPAISVWELEGEYRSPEC